MTRYAEERFTADRLLGGVSTPRPAMSCALSSNTRISHASYTPLVAPDSVRVPVAMAKSEPIALIGLLKAHDLGSDMYSTAPSTNTRSRASPIVHRRALRDK